MRWLKAPRSSPRIKHNGVRFHFVRLLVRLERVAIHSATSAEQHADILANQLGREVLRRHLGFVINR